jgi:ribose/xylose/arabinose/galactoside ABC-type transport system permease subunit
MKAITAAILGGTSLKGDKERFSGTVCWHPPNGSSRMDYLL